MVNYIFIIIIISFILTVKTVTVTIKNEKDFIEQLSKSSNKEVTLTIDGGITVTKEITLPSIMNKLFLIGKTSSTSKVAFKYPFNFGDNLEEIELKNIEVNGTLHFHNNKKITLDNIILNGNIDTDMNNSINDYIKFNKLIYRPTENTTFSHCINIIGNVEITDSNFTGGSSCQNRIINFNGLNKYYINIKNSNFTGEYQCSCLSITQSKKAYIQYSNFENGFSGKGMDGGHNNGGAFYIYNVYIFQGENLTFNNVTSLESGSIANVASDSYSSVFFNNITQKNTGNMEGMKDGGLIMKLVL
ncbi:hypothetical protein PIROE2DRAFT_8105 [Piromyces sp. E2]|nr:hypothetical protein PIROE2DRAFT_8105 [Piromyces sp. E2]|eukprot:OUM64962.1 hypothetical protein PIROE2DRAFT_8105 [Piromyces sp. E2]